ncbi:LysR family transcriptional regulator [Frateuria aurantia]
MNKISPRQLQVFVETAGQGTLRAAAERLYLTQPAASMALAQMERQLGGEVFQREHGRLRLNARGRELLPKARELLARLEEFGQLQQSEPAQWQGELWLGASHTIGNYLLGDWLAPFVQQYPRVSLRLQVGNTDRIAAAVVAQELDAGWVEGPVSDPQLEVSRVGDDALVICAPPAHRLAARGDLQADDFAGESWILREPGSATRLQSEQILARLPVGRTALVLDQTEAIKQAVSAGLGLGLLPAVAVREAAHSGRLRVLPTPFLELQRPLLFLLHRQAWRSELLRRLLATVHQAAGASVGE